MFLSPNFEINKDIYSNIITPKLNEKGVVDAFMFVEKLGEVGSAPIILEEKISRNRVLLGKADGIKNMWLYPSGEIKVEI